MPYYDRGAIEDGALDGQRLEICWLKDPFEALSISIQGSARVILEDGTPLRINYDAHNGYPYTAVGRVLIERNHIPREEMSMQRIREWMSVNPDEAREVRHTNRSFVFFRITGLSNEGEPAGAQGVPLTPLRSIAVDKIHVYGTPFYIEANLPIDSAKPTTPFRRLMIAQDTGSAIVGPARADLYWGAGADAGRIAGRIRHAGRFVMLLPRELDMVEAGKHMPLPLKKPAIPADDDKKDEAKKTTRRRTPASPSRRRPSPKTRRSIRRKSRRQAGPDRSQAAIMSAHDAKPRRRKLSEEERALWGRITRSIAPLREGRLADPTDPAETAAVPNKPKPAPSARPHRGGRERCAEARAAAAAARPAAEAAACARHRTDRCPHRSARPNAGEAHAALLRFLRARRRMAPKFVLVITGKGARARPMWSERGVLKRQVPLWLRLPEFRPIRGRLRAGPCRPWRRRRALCAGAPARAG